MSDQSRVRTITCRCGRTVTGRMRESRIWCSLGCYRRSERPARKTGTIHSCDVCGIDVYTPKSREGLHNYFCSREHANAWQGRNKTTHTCTICGGTFRWSPSRTDGGKYNVTYCSLACRDADPARRNMLLAMNVAQQAGRTTKPERIGYDILDTLGIPYLPQHLLAGKFCVDAFLPQQGIVVQFDGDYWHGNPATFPEPDARQMKRMRLDKSQDAYLAKCGHRVVRIWASQLQGDPEGVRSLFLRLATPQ